MPPQYRQGDVLLIKIEAQPTTRLTPVPRVQGLIILAQGEATGHAHAIDSTLADLFEARNGTLYLRTKGTCHLTHQEHAPIKLDKGFYEVRRQREYDPYRYDQRPVND
jgi:hypothetical protein